MDELRWLQQVVLQDFSTLETNIISSTEVLHVWKNKTDQNGLRYLPNFHLIFQAHQDETMTLRLVTFHGKTVDSVVFRRRDNEGSKVPDHIQQTLTELSSNIKLCHGVSKENLEPGEYLTEYLNDVIIVRSTRCRFKLKDCNEALQCDECTKIIPSVKTEPFVITKIEGDEESDDKALVNPIHKNDDDDDDFVDGNESLTIMNEGEYDDDWEVTLYKNEEPVDYGPIKKPGVAAPKKKKKRSKKHEWPKEIAECSEKYAKVEPGAVCKPIVEIVDPDREKHLRAMRIAARKHGGSSLGRPTNNAAAEKGKDKFRTKCTVCLRVYKSRPSYEEDQARHAKYFDLEGSISCPLCRENVAKLEVTAHFTSHHSTEGGGGGEPMTCCIGCLLVMPNTDGTLRKHVIKFHHNQAICESCGRVFNDPRLFDIHVKAAHSDVRDHFCDRCGKAFAHRLLLEKHMSHACSMEEWICPICSKVFSCKDKLRFHLATHCDLKPYVCRYCPYSSNKCDNICIHVKKVHKMRGFRDDTTVLEDVLKLQKQFIKEQLAKVDKTHHRKPYQRSDTSAAHPYSKAMQVPQICHICGKTYASGDSIRRHLDLHSGRRPYKCKLCGYSALKASVITVRHYNFFHADENISEADCLLVDETELEEMREFSNREFLNLTPAAVTSDD